jgi:hypothetical protein
MQNNKQKMIRRRSTCLSLLRGGLVCLLFIASFGNALKAFGVEQHQQQQQQQTLLIIRHGARWDYQHPEWLETAERRGDPPLSPLGLLQARDTGVFLNQHILPHKKQITWLSSPFLRCLQTSDEMLHQIHSSDHNIMIHPESSVWEIDLDGSDAPLCLPSLQERKCYFPRLNDTHKSLFIPPIPGK